MPPLQAQLDALLDATTERAVSVIVQAHETDPAAKRVASAAAQAGSDRRLAARPNEVVFGRAASERQSVSRVRTKSPSRSAALSVVRPLLGTDAVKRALGRSGEDRAANAVTPLLAARAVAATLTRDELAGLVDESDAVYAVYPNRVLRIPRVLEVDKLPPAAAASRAAGWGVERIGALSVWGAYGTRGRGVKVGVLDTGVDADHPDLKGKVVNWAEFDGHGARVTGSTAHDTDRHGTHVCGTIVGGDASGKWIGVAPDARLAVGLVLDGRQGGTDAQALAGIDWVLERGVEVVSMSLGAFVLGPETPGTYTRAILECFLRGVPVVAAMGNEGDGTGGSPGSDLFAVSVGATDPDDVVAGFSSGRTQVVTSSDVIQPGLLPLPYAKPEVSAPGVAIESSVPGGQWQALSGTSMAAPHTSGAIALLLAATGRLAGVDPRDRVGTVVDLLVGGVRELGESGQDHRYGFGRIDVLRSIGLAHQQGFRGA